MQDVGCRDGRFVNDWLNLTHGLGFAEGCARTPSSEREPRELDQTRKRWPRWRMGQRLIVHRFRFRRFSGDLCERCFVKSFTGDTLGFVREVFTLIGDVIGFIIDKLLVHWILAFVFCFPVYPKTPANEDNQRKTRWCNTGFRNNAGVEVAKEAECRQEWSHSRISWLVRHDVWWE